VVPRRADPPFARPRELAAGVTAADPRDAARQGGNPDSCGVWAPCLSYADGRFWLVYTDVKRNDGKFKDAHNYIVTAETIDGDWSDPTYVNSSGFDPSLFHDDGRKWFVNLRWNHRGGGTGGNPKHDSFDGIILQEWDPKRGLIGEVTDIYLGTPRGLTEGPHLFKRNGWYYLTTAEGGTGYGHAVPMARARDIRGPYETHPDLHLVCAADAPGHPIQRTGHGQYVEAADGSHWHTFLMGRPISNLAGEGRFCPLGRETGIERCVWRDDWLYLEGGGLLPRVEVPSAAPGQGPGATETDFSEGLPAEFQWLRTPEPERIFRTGRDGLTLIGRESLGSWFEQALVARRQEHLAYAAETELGFAPETYQQAAGLTTYYNRHKFHAALVTSEPRAGRVLSVVSCLGDWPDAALTYHKRALPLADGPVALRVEVDGARQRFYLGASDGWKPVGPELEATVVSDEAGRGEHGSFTGAFVGVLAFDTSGAGREATFRRFAYTPLA
jgi:xylan 1,4-beta-xylosidase